MSEKKIVAEAKTGDGTVIEINLPEIDKTIQKLVEESPKLKEYFEELKEYKAKKAEGKGVVEAMSTDRKTKLVEALRNVRQADIKEQWTVVVPSATAYEVAGNLRAYVFVSDVVQGKQGETVNIPYVKDFDFVQITPEADSLTEATSIISTLTTTLKEAGKYTQVPYADIEMIDSNLLDELNQRFVRAAVRSEDLNLITEIGTKATTSYAGIIDGQSDTAAFYARYIPEAIGKLLMAGKDVHPGELILYINGEPYATLLEELSASHPQAFAIGEPLKSGVLTEYMGVKIVVGGYQTGSHMTTSTDTGTHLQAFLMRPKRALALCPKRELLIETDRLIKERVLKIVGSHTFGVVAIDLKEIVPIFTNLTKA
jgi:hypothetical protein